MLPKTHVAQRIREYLAELLGCLAREDYYALLGVEPTASEEAIRTACHDVASLLSERSLAHAEPGLRRGADRVKLALLRAECLLTHPDSREAYDASRRHKQRRPVRAVIGWMAAGVIEPPAQDGTARRVEKDAAELATEGWKLLTNPALTREERLERARTPLEQACARAPWDATARYCMAGYWRVAGSPRQYRGELEATLRCDSAHPRARHELRALEAAEKAVRLAADKPSPGLRLVSLFRRA